MFLPHPLLNLSIVGSLRDREVACSASDLQGLNFESCVWRAVSSYSSHHPQEVLLAQFSLYVHKGGLKPDSFHFISIVRSTTSVLKMENIIRPLGYERLNYTLDMKGCICHFTKWQIHPFMSKGTICEQMTNVKVMLRFHN